MINCAATFAASDPPYPLLARPFINTNPNVMTPNVGVGQSSEVVAGPGVANGNVVAALKSTVWGADINYRRYLAGTCAARLDGLNLGPRELRSFRRVKILGCGSAYYVGMMGAAMIEELARVPADAEPASEFRYRNPIIEPDTLYVAVSQSGETADTAFAVQEVKRKGGQIVGLVNVVGSTIARECDGGIYLHAGP